MQKKKVNIERILYISGAILLIAGVALGIYQYAQNKKHEQMMEKLKGLVQEDRKETSVSEKVSDKQAEYKSPYENVFEQNKDCVAWLKIPDTKIDYPVMHTPAQEDYYLYKNYYGEDDKNGCLILAAACKLDEPMTNLLIHGHNMKSGEMFGDLDLYKDFSYAATHNEIILYTKKMEKHYEVTAAFYGKILDKEEEGFRYYQFFQAHSEKDFDAYYGNIKKLNLYDNTKEASYGDELITLSTCSNVGKAGRFVVVGRRVD